MSDSMPELQHRIESMSRKLLGSEEGLGQIIAQNADGILIVDGDGIILFSNPAAEQLFGRPSRELVGTVLGFPLVQGEPAEVEIVKDGRRVRVVEMRVVRMNWEGATASLASLRDVTRRKEVEEALRTSQERYALALEGANDGIWDLDLTHHLVFFSPRWKFMLGYRDHEIQHRMEEWHSRVHPDDLELFKLEMQAHIDGSTATFKNEHRVRHRNGTYIWVLARGQAVRDGFGVATRIAGSMTDITSRKETEARLAHDALHDPLTELPNRALLFERLDLCIRRGRRRPNTLFAVLFLDLDRFKVINDSLGHIVGDLLLKEIAERLRSCIRPGDTVARIGGDEFTILLDDIRGSSDAVRVARRVQAVLGQPFRLEGHEVFTRASIGIALGAMEYTRPEDIIRDADAAMYRAKTRGRGRYEMFDRRMHRDALQILQTETDLRHALSRNQFEVFYQPIVDLVDGTLEGFEALLRWRHPERGLLLPGQFLALAQETGVLHVVDRWVLERACRDLKGWLENRRGHRPLTVSVNLPPSQLEEPMLVSEVSRILKETGLDPGHLRLEIAESALQDETEQSLSALMRFRELGIGLYVDDFGAGFSSLSRLIELPVDTLKIDRSFVMGMEDKPESRKIVRTIVHLARNLQLGVIAEGVESIAQVNELRKSGCKMGQGFYFSEPTPASVAEEFTRAESVLPF